MRQYTGKRSKSNNLRRVSQNENSDSTFVKIVRRVARSFLRYESSTRAIPVVIATCTVVIGVMQITNMWNYSTKYRSLTWMLFTVALIGIVSWLILRQARRVREVFIDEIKSVELGKIREDDFERFDQVQQLREEKARKDFESNLGSKLVLERLEVRGMLLFPRAEWNIQPGLNILLGRNGYGKSLILRMLAGVLQHDDELLPRLFSKQSGKRSSSVTVRLKRDGEDALISRNAGRFTESVGKLPLLAIPDSRFIDRSQGVVAPLDSATTDLRIHGAHHFLQGHAYGSVVQALLYELCLDYWEHGRSFDLPVFEFLSTCIRRLTDYEFCFHAIDRKGRTGFEILVLTEGNDDPLPIQNASQGTLSLLAMLGLIRSYLRSLQRNSDDGLVQQGSAIVFIDEADAHLHPTWQQKFPSLLRDFFPNVQFILSAHSPLFVAGCWRGEVAVLRRNRGRGNQMGFTVDQLDQDFVGATASELYEKIFEIEEMDATYLEYATKSTRRRDTKRITTLSNQSEHATLSQGEHNELRTLEEEERRIARAGEISQQRKEEGTKDARIEALESEMLKLRTQLTNQSKGSAG